MLTRARVGRREVLESVSAGNTGVRFRGSGGRVRLIVRYRGIKTEPDRY